MRGYLPKLRIEVLGGVVTAVYKDTGKNLYLLTESVDYDLIDYDNLENEVQQ